MSALPLLALAASAAMAFDGNDELVVALVGGAELRGWYLRAEDGVLVLSGENRFTEVPIAAIAGITRDGEVMERSAWQAELGAAQAALDAWRADPPPHPPVPVVVGLSLAWGGAGHAALGEWRTFAGYSALEAVLIGTAALSISQGGNPGVLLSLAAVDLLSRGHAAADAARLSRSRRARLARAPELPAPEAPLP